ncbi:TPA: hypothetical protein N0F65_010733 [Lagenidium giganteum]|uniref:Aminopeptidase n=1 Tax=Lagenidium giganteum TaxID=4803 RepID=A0AAV2YL62_9STRA|nr:TPA: hypothetical protein N0F65_010733 [Lagenidium giganteum]
MAAPATKEFARLPTNVVPSKYHIDYDVIDLMNFRFEAAERIELRIAEDTTTITCHAVELYVYDVAIEYETPGSQEKVKQEAEHVSYTTKDESVQFQFAQTIPAGAANVVLSLRFHGFLNDQLKGFYRSEYEWENERRALAVTQFEACDARRAFVCWDEPAIKATYEISMVTDPDMTALSNMHVVQTQVRPKKNAHLRKNSRKDSGMEKWWKFAETPIMSTYLVAMVVGEFDSINDVSSEGVLVNVYTPLGKSERGRFALDVALKSLTYFSERFGIPYPLKKLDMVAIPDFLGAMENWGLVTYMESYLLIDDKLSSHEQRADTARTVCHEISHQWFGNLVTMEWWTGLWLNEGFAHFMEFDAVNHIFPEWKVWDTFVQEGLMGVALTRDCMHSSHPIEVIVHHPSEVDEIFDAISYDKGASIVRMLSEYLGREVFFQGVHNYLVKYSYQNTVTEDLWAELEKASGQKITEMAKTWTQKMGYPLISLVKRENGSYAITQERFFADKTMKGDDASLWDVPLTLVTSDQPATVKRIGIWAGKSSSPEGTQTPLLADEAVNAQLIVPSDANGWIKLNYDQAGYYLVNYPSEMWKKLQAPIKSKTFSVVDRLSLLNSIYSLAGSGIVPVSEALDFTGAFEDESEHLCWREISQNLSTLCLMFMHDPFYPKLQAFIRKLFSKIMAKLTWEPTSADESSEMGDFRSDVILVLGRAGDEAVIAEAKRRFVAYVGGDSSALNADIRLAVFKIHGWHSDEVHVTQLQKLYETSDFSEEKEHCLLSLGSVASPRLKQQVLDWALANVRAADIPRVFAGFAADPTARDLAWRCIQDNWDMMSTKFSGMTVGRAVCTIVGHFQSEDKGVEVAKFLESRNTSAFDRKLEDALEKIKVQSARYARDRDVLAQWLEARN